MHDHVSVICFPITLPRMSSISLMLRIGRHIVSPLAQ